MNHEQIAAFFLVMLPIALFAAGPLFWRGRGAGHLRWYFYGRAIAFLLIAFAIVPAAEHEAFAEWTFAIAVLALPILWIARRRYSL